MTELETKTSPISKWVESIRIPNRKNQSSFAMSRTHDYHHRIKKTKEKIESLSDALQPYLKARNADKDGGYMAVHAGDGTIMDANDILDELHYAIGTYAVPMTGVWYDYFGRQEIRESGGYIVVMLSDEGVDLLNKIAKEVLSTTTV